MNIEDTLYICSFCGKNQNEVEKIITGNDACICNECISVCCAILDEEGIEYKNYEYQNPEELECFFCKKQKKDVSFLISGPSCYICDECLSKIKNYALQSQDINGTCSFCGRTQDEVKILAQNGKYSICNECVDLSIEILEDKINNQNKPID